MNTKIIEARELVIKAREALRRGDKPSAWKMGEQAALLAADMEDVWLILAASDPNPQDALAYAQKALEINPSSTRAQRAVEWTQTQLKQARFQRDQFVIPQKIELIRESPPAPQPAAKPGNRNLIYAASFLGLLVCAVMAIAAYSAVTHPAFASILNSKAAPTQENLWAPVKIAKPSQSPIEPSAFAQQAVSTPTPKAKPTKAPPKSSPNEGPVHATDIPTEAPTFTPGPTETPGTMAMEVLADTPTSAYVAPAPSGPLPAIAKSGNGVRWIDVDLTHQAVYAYEGDVMVNSFIVSTGTRFTPTVTGQYKIYVKFVKANMHGPGYFLPDVPYVMYFYKGYGLHGTYWHHNFGTPMSHGCVNLETGDAAWLFSWASVGTVVNVHY